MPCDFVLCERCVSVVGSVGKRDAQGTVVDFSVVEMLDEGVLFGLAKFGQVDLAVCDDLHGGTEALMGIEGDFRWTNGVTCGFALLLNPLGDDRRRHVARLLRRRPRPGGLGIRLFLRFFSRMMYISFIVGTSQ